MPKTHEFTDNATGKPIAVVIDKIVVFKKDEFSECTSIELIGGTKIGVSETIDQVQKVVEDANRT